MNPFQPYYQDDRATIYHANSAQLLPFLDCFDLLLTDPPYGIFTREDDGVMFGKPTIYSKDKTAPQWDQRPAASLMALAMDKAAKRIVWGGNYLADLLGPWRGPLVWNKLTGNNSYADGELAWSDVVGTMRIFSHQWCGAFKDSERNQPASHPTQKPLALMQWCLGLVPDAQTVLDPFAGVGTSIVAAKLEGRQGVGIEISEAYCEKAARRLEQGLLF